VGRVGTDDPLLVEQVIPFPREGKEEKTHRKRKKEKKKRKGVYVIRCSAAFQQVVTCLRTVPQPSTLEERGGRGG